MRRSGAGGLASDEMGWDGREEEGGPAFGQPNGATSPRKSQKPEANRKGGAGGRARARPQGDSGLAWVGFERRQRALKRLFSSENNCCSQRSEEVEQESADGVEERAVLVHFNNSRSRPGCWQSARQSCPVLTCLVLTMQHYCLPGADYHR